MPVFVTCPPVVNVCKAQDKEVQGVQKLVPYKIVEGQDGAAWVEVQGNKMSPSQVSETPLSAYYHHMPSSLLSLCLFYTLLSRNITIVSVYRFFFLQKRPL